MKKTVSKLTMYVDHLIKEEISMRIHNLFLCALLPLMVFSFCIGDGSFTFAEAADYSFIKYLIKKDSKALSTIAKEIDISDSRRMLPAETLSNTTGIPAHMLTPAVRRLAVVGEEIVGNGKFASNFLNKSSIPEEVIRQYSRYGKGSYLELAKSTQKVMENESKSKIINILEKIKKNYKSLNEVINKYNAGKYDDDIMVRTLRNTGKRGIEVLSWLAEHPGIASAGAATAWYLYDPEGFEEALNQSGKKIGGFVGETLVNASGGIGEGVSAGLKKAVDIHSLRAILGGAAAILIVLLFIFGKTFRRILLFPFTFIGIKLNKRMDQAETEAALYKQPLHVPSTDFQHQSGQTGSTHKPKSNF